MVPQSDSSRTIAWSTRESSAGGISLFGDTTTHTGPLRCCRNTSRIFAIPSAEQHEVPSKACTVQRFITSLLTSLFTSYEAAPEWAQQKKEPLWKGSLSEHIRIYALTTFPPRRQRVHTLIVRFFVPIRAFTFMIFGRN